MALHYPREVLAQAFEERQADLDPKEREVRYELVDTVFFASLMLEEGGAVRVGVVHHDEGAAGLATVLDDTPEGGGQPALAWNVMRMESERFGPQALAKLSRGLEYGSQLAVVGGTEGGELKIDGIARRNERTDGGDVIRIATPRPGVLVFEYRLSEVLRFEAGRRTPSPVELFAGGPLRSAIGAITGDLGEEDYSFTESAIVRLLRKMRATGAGAILAMSAADADAKAMGVRHRPVDGGLLRDRIAADKARRLEWVSVRTALAEGNVTAEQIRARVGTLREARIAEEALTVVIEDLARLSAVDGALLMGPKLEVYGAGYIISGAPHAPEVVRALDVEGRKTKAHLLLHGARHQAAFDFAWNNPGGVAFVVSEDGPVSCAMRIGERVVVWAVRISET